MFGFCGKNKERGENMLFSKKKSAKLFLRDLAHLKNNTKKPSVTIFFRNLDIFHFWSRSEQQKRKYDLK